MDQSEVYTSNWHGYLKKKRPWTGWKFILPPSPWVFFKFSHALDLPSSWLPWLKFITVLQLAPLGICCAHRRATRTLSFCSCSIQSLYEWCGPPCWHARLHQVGSGRPWGWRVCWATWQFQIPPNKGDNLNSTSFKIHVQHAINLITLKAVSTSMFKLF